MKFKKFFFDFCLGTRDYYGMFTFVIILLIFILLQYNYVSFFRIENSLTGI